MVDLLEGKYITIDITNADNPQNLRVPPLMIIAIVRNDDGTAAMYSGTMSDFDRCQNPHVMNAVQCRRFIKLLGHEESHRRPEFIFSRSFEDKLTLMIRGQGTVIQILVPLTEMDIDKYYREHTTG